MRPKNILIVSGEPSGDLYAAKLVNDLKRLKPDIKFFGLGGELSKKAGVDVVFDISRIALIGLVEVLKNIFTVKTAYQKLSDRINSEKVDLAILLDYPGFNLRLAKMLKKKGIPVIYYISPQVWAWGRDRVKIIKNCVERIIVFFKFEEELYKTYGIDVKFVGHPLVEIVKTTVGREDTLKKYNLSGSKTTIALLPGSRMMEVKSLLPIMLGAARMIDKKIAGTQFVVAKHPDLPQEMYDTAIRDSGLDIEIAEGDTYNVLGASEFAIVASGTATLETTMIGTPFVLIYKTSVFTYIAYKIVAITPFLGLANVIAGKEIVPELLQFDATPEKIAEKSIEFLKDKAKRNSMTEEFKKVSALLGSSGASLRAAEAILPFLQ